MSLSIAAGQGRIRRRAGEHAEIRIKESSFGAVKIDTGDADAWSIMGKGQLQTLRTLSFEPDEWDHWRVPACPEAQSEPEFRYDPGPPI